MTALAKRAIVVGLDGASMELVRHMADRGHVPNLARLMAHGVHREMLGVLPTLTPPGWTSLATGCWPGTHGVMDFHVRRPGRPLDESDFGINPGLCKAEYLWNTAERGGRIPILVKWEMSWPPTIKTGIQVEGTGPGVSNHAQLAGYHLFATREYEGYRVGGELDTEDVDPSALQGPDVIDMIELKPAQGWVNLPSSQCPHLEAELLLRPLVRTRPIMRRGNHGTPKSYHALVFAQGNDGYDRIMVAPQKDGSRAMASLAPREWSDWWRDSFVIDGQPVEGSVRCKLVRLSP